MDFNGNGKNSGKRRAQTIQEMINNAPSTGQGGGIRRSNYAGPKNAGAVSQNTSDLSGINVNRSEDYSRWGNSNEGMPKPKKQRYKADVGNPMRGNFLKRDLEQSRERLDRKSRDIDRRRRADRDDFDATGELPDVSRRGGGAAANRYGRSGGYVAPAYRGPLDSYGWIVFCSILVVCIMVTLLASGLKPRSSGYIYPMNVITISGVINSSYEHRMGVGGTFGGSSGYKGTTGDSQESTDTVMPDGTKQVDAVDPNSLTDLGSEGEAATLDDGTMEVPGVTQATSHSELVSQIQAALSAGNYAFISAKFAYEDEATGQLDAYPMSQIKHFCQYMTSNPDKISSFINNISSEEYSATNGTAFVLKLPVMKFTVKMGASTDSFVLDNTVVSVSGFSDVVVNGNQNAAIYPLLPCIYNVTLTNNAWATPSQSQEIEATLGEGNLEIKVGQASE